MKCSWHNTVIYTESQIWMTGCNKYGQLGQGTNDIDFSKKFLPVETHGTVNSFHCMSESFILHSINGEKTDFLYTWGWNEHGNLGHGDKVDRNKPEQIRDISNVKDIYAGGAFFLI